MTRLIHGEEGLATALKVTEGAAPGTDTELNPDSLREIAKDMPCSELLLDDILDQKFVDIVVKIGLLPSKGEASRLIQNGGAYLNNQKIDDANFRLSEDSLIGGNSFFLVQARRKK